MTIIEAKHKTLLFIHVPKCAGISICKAFGYTTSGHGTIKSFSPDLYPHYYIFTFVRNPYSRLLSIYNYLKSGGVNPQDSEDYKRYLSEYKDFEDFIMVGLKNNSEFLFNQQHLKPQHYFTHLNNNTTPLNFIGKFESLKADFNQLLVNISQKNSDLWNNLPHENKGGTSKHWEEYYSDAMKEIVYETYKLDFELFDYEI